MSLLTIRSGATQMSEDVFLAFFRDFLASGGVLSTSATDFQVAAQTSPDMTVKVQAGRIMIKGASSNAYPVINTADSNQNITSNSSGNSRIDAIVAYIDLSATADTTASNIAKLAVIAGTPAASPSAPDSTAIGAVIGASNPYEVLAYVTVGNGVSSIVTGNISDQRRKFLTVADNNAQLNSSCYGADAGSTDAYAITLNPVPTAYSTGMRLYFKANTVNTGACTLNVNGLGAKSIVKSYNIALEDGDIKANQIVEVIYDGTNFQLVSTIADEGIITVADGATITLDSSLSKQFITTLAGNRQLALSNLKTGRPVFLTVVQDATGTRVPVQPVTATDVVSITIATPGVITTTKDMPTCTPIVFTTTGALPTGITAGTRYYWVRTGATTGNIATTIANAQAGTVIATSGSQSGVHTMSVQVRWGSTDTVPTLTTGKHRRDTLCYVPQDALNGIVQGNAVNLDF